MQCLQAGHIHYSLRGDRMNTLQRHKEQVQEAINFLAKTKFSSAQNLQDIVGRNRRGFATQLTKLGICVSRAMPGNLKIIGLSTSAAQIAGVKKYDIHKASMLRVDHNLTAQAELIWLMNYGFPIESYDFEPQKCSETTRPDIGLYLNNGMSINVEIELSQKHIKRGEMDRFVSKIFDSTTIVVFKEPALMDLYVRYIREYIKNGIPKWKNTNGAWHKTEEMECLTEYELERVSFKLHKQDIWIEMGELKS